MTVGTKKKYLSTTLLAKSLNIPVKNLFIALKKIGFIKREGDRWELTETGSKKGGTVKKHPKHGEYIAWDEALVAQLKPISQDQNEQSATTKTPAKKTNIHKVNATTISKHFGISLYRINPILSELGWIEKEGKGWKVTKLGLEAGGKQLTHENGITYVCWEDKILKNKSLVNTMNELKGDDEEVKDTKNSNKKTDKSFREKFVPTHRAADGHYVRSRGEMLIDNWLYMSEIVHAYERKLPVEENIYCDFYLPGGKVYIEYWGLENDPKYRKRKEEKVGIYTKYSFNLVEINDDDIQNLDDVLPSKLLKYGIKAY